MKNIKLINEFFDKRTLCPMCGGKLLRKIKATWQKRTRKLEFISDPVNAENYDNMVFVKYVESFMTMFDNDPEDQASPNLFSLKDCSPPSLAFLNINNVSSLCSKQLIEYHLSAKGPDFIPVSERFWLKGYDVFITPNSINETVNGLKIPTEHSHILKYTADEIRIKIEKLVLLQ
jgi:hypothetical protein